MSAKPNMSASTDSAARADHPLRPISFGTPAVHRRAPRRRHHLSAAESAAAATIRCASPTACIIGPRPRPIASSWRSANAARGWRQITYAELLASSRHIASALLARGLSAEKPVVILSGNSIDHALIAFGALYAGIPVLPGVAGLFAGVAGLRQARLSDEAADAGPRLRRRRREIRRCAGRQRVPWHRDRGVARRGAGPRRHDAGRI